MKSSVTLLLFVLLFASPVAAQETDVHAAAAAFEEGQRAQLRGDFAQAADLFEIADRAAPNAAALRAAIRNDRAAGRPARAATLAAEAQTRYPDDAETLALATETIGALTATLGRFDLRCATACSVTLDARAVIDHPIESYVVFVEPGAHVLVASFHAHGVQRREIDARAGEEVSVELEAPAATETPVVATEEPSRGEDPVAVPPVPHGTGLHPALFGTLAGLAVVSLGITIWSGIDTLNAAAEYRDDPTHARYDDGIGRELRSNVLIGVTSALAIAALVSVFFTDWDDIGPSPEEHVRRSECPAEPGRYDCVASAARTPPIALTPSFYASSDGGGLTILGRY